MEGNAKKTVISVRCLGSVVGQPCSAADGPSFLPPSLSPDTFLAVFSKAQNYFLHGGYNFLMSAPILPEILKAVFWKV